MKTVFGSLIACLLCFLLSCSSSPTKPVPYPKSTQTVIAKASQAGFSAHRYTTTPFVITAYERLHSSQHTTIHAYIEGDGNSWKTKYRLSNNPTPKQPLALRLAIKDPHPNVIYLARPCQYTPPDLNPACEGKYWSSHRYSEEVINSMNQTLNQIKEKAKNTHFVLVGFSGGASVATLVASRRQDIQSIITVAGDLDHHALTDHHGTTPLHGSLNPMHVTEQIKHIPQHHWAGKKDKIVPSWMPEHFVKKLNSPVAKAHVLKDATHHKGWEKHWHEILPHE